jgi:hypothetical protein
MADIITLAEYRDYDDLPSPTENEGQIEKAIDAATSYIEKRAGRVFEDNSPSPVDAVEILDGKDTNRLYTHNAPINAVSKLEYWDGTQWVEYDSTSYPYSFKSGSNIIYFTDGHTFYAGWQNIRATFTYGYTTVPEDLKLACYLIAKHIVNLAERLGITTQTDGEQSFSYEQTIPKEAQNIIARYRTVW